MSGSESANDQKKPTTSSVVVTTAAGSSSAPSAFSIDGLLGLKQREVADKTIKEEKGSNSGSTSSELYHSTTKSGSADMMEQQASAMAQASATHLVYSAAAAASGMVPSPALHGALWSSHPAASIAAFRCKYMHAMHACTAIYLYMYMHF